MKSLTSVILVLIGLVIITGVAFFGYQFYLKLNAPAESPFKAIPPNTAMVIKFNRPSLFWSQSKQENVLWKDLFSIRYLSFLRDKVNFLDSAIRTNEKLGISAGDNPLFIVFSQTMSDSYGVLFMINTPEGIPDDEIIGFIRKIWSSGIEIKKSSYAGSSIHQVNDLARKNNFFFAVRSGIFIGSASQILVKQAIDRLSLNLSNSDDQNFQKVVDISGKNVDVNVFINFEKTAPVMTNIFKEGILADYLNVSHFAAWTGLDLMQKKDAWLVSGYTLCNENSYEYLSLFAGQSPQPVAMPAVLPGNTASFTWIGLDDPRAYNDLLVSSRTSTSIYKPIYPDLLQFENRNQFQLVDYFLPWTGNEMGLVTCPKSQSQAKDSVNVFGVFRISDKDLADSLLQSLGHRVQGQIKKDVFKDRTVYSLNITDLVPGVWGNLFRKLRGSCYTFIDNYIIFGNDPLSLRDFIEQVSSGNVLKKDLNYLQFSENLPEESNLCYYFNIWQSITNVRNLLSEDILKETDPSLDSLRSFESFGAQFTNNGENLITNIIINHKKSGQSKGPLVWQAELDSVILGKPLIILNALKGKPAVLAYDLSNTMYLTDWSGSIQWKLKLPGQPMGDIYEIRSKRSDSVYFLFNTLKEIYIVDINGLFAYNSPFPLPVQAAAGLACFEIPDPGNYQIFIPLEDKKVYSFNLSGKQKPGWNYPAMDVTAAKPLQLMKLQNKDFLFITSKSGQVLVTDISGKPMIQPRNKVQFSTLSDFYINKTNSKGPFLSSLREGNLVYLKNDGKTSDVKFNNFTTDHVFYYTDINNDGIQEFIYFDLNKIYFYNRFQKLLFDYTFPSRVLPPFLLKSPAGHILLGTVAPKSGEIFLFGNNGLLPLDPAFKGNTLFDIKFINEEFGISLVVGAGRYLKNYQLPE